MQAIVIKFLCPTNVKGSRYKAIAEAGSVTLSTDFALNGEGNAARAALALCDKFGWPGDLIVSSLPTGGYVAVLQSDTKVANPITAHRPRNPVFVRIGAAS